MAQVPADHGDTAAPHPLTHQTADGRRCRSGFLLPAGCSKKPQFRGGRHRLRGAFFQQAGHRRQTRRLLVTQIFPQQHRHSHLRPVFSGQRAQLRCQLLCPGEQPQIPRLRRGPVIAQSHRHRRTGCQQRPQQTLFGRIEGVELVNKHHPALQKLRHRPPGLCRFQPSGGQLQPVGRVHPCLGKQGLVALVDQGQLTEFGLLRPAALGQVIELCAGDAGTFQLIDGLGCHLAKGSGPAVAVIVLDVVLQLFQRAAHQHRPACIGQGAHRCAAFG